MRETGFYWVRIANKWAIAEWSVGPLGGGWLAIGWDIHFDDDAT